MRDFASVALWVSMVVGSVLLCEPAAVAHATTNIGTRYLMTVKLPIDLSPFAEPGPNAVYGPAEGWVTGALSGSISVPSRQLFKIILGDDARLKLDAYVTIETDEHEIVHMTYNSNLTTADRFCKDESSRADDCYLLGTPRFETTSEKYSWLNSIQVIGQMVEFNSKEGYLLYDLFAVHESNQDPASSQVSGE